VETRQDRSPSRSFPTHANSPGYGTKINEVGGSRNQLMISAAHLPRRYRAGRLRGVAQAVEVCGKVLFLLGFGARTRSLQSTCCYRREGDCRPHRKQNAFDVQIQPFAYRWALPTANHCFLEGSPDHGADHNSSWLTASVTCVDTIMQSADFVSNIFWAKLATTRKETQRAFLSLWARRVS